MFSWGIGNFFAKMAANRIGNQSVFFDISIYAPVIIIFCLLFFKFDNLSKIFQENRNGVYLAMLAGATASIGMIGAYYLLTKEEASKMVPLTALYPIVTVILAIIFLKESITITKIAGIFFSLLAIFLLSI